MKSDIEKKQPISTLEILKEQLDTYANQLNEIQKAENLSSLVCKEFLDLSNSYISVSDHHYNELNTSQELDFNAVYILNYVLPEFFKDVMLIHRDVLLQLQIARSKKLECQIDEDAVALHFLDSKNILLKALNFFTIKMSEEQNAAQQTDKKRRKIFAKVKHLENPWGIYKSQFLTIQNQLQTIVNSTQTLLDVILVFEDIKNHTRTICSSVLNEVESSKQSVTTIIDSILNVNASSKISNIISLIDNIFSELDLSTPQQEAYTLAVESKINALSEQNLPVASEDGLLLTKKIDFNKSVKKWLDYKLLPLLIELWNNRVSLVSFYKHNLLNLKSSLILVKNNDPLNTLSSQTIALQNVLHSLEANEAQQQKTYAQIQENLNHDLLATNIYSNEDFLKVSLQSSLSQFKSSKSNVLNTLRKKTSSLLSSFNKKYEISTSDNPQKKLETSVKCIDYRIFEESNTHYNSLFLNKNFIGDLFLVPREAEKQKLLESLNLWKEGYSKAVLVLGDDLSGKSTFLESIAKEYFDKQTIVLEANSTISVEGRKFNTSKNLAEALQHIKKNIYNSRPLIIIDNLELWRDKDHSLLDNIHSAIQFIESESNNVFVMMATSDAMRTHLDKRLPFTHLFSSIIDVNKAKFEEIYKAILLRHGASHRSLVSESGISLSNKHIELNVQRLCKYFDYNMGEVLQAWTYGVNLTDDNKVIYLEEDYKFEDFFTDEEVIILKYVLLYKYTNEIILKNFLGKRYDSIYKSSLRRLINTKVFLRNAEGNLLLNPSLYHDIREILKYRGVLN